MEDKIDAFIDGLDDNSMALLMERCLRWLGEQGRTGARLVQSAVGDDSLTNIGEAVAWLEDIENRKEI